MKTLFLSTAVFILSLNISFSQSGWYHLNSGSGFDLQANYFTNENTGYAVGAGGTIVKTTNSGLNWQMPNSGTELFLRSVFFTDMNTGYTCGASTSNVDTGIVLKTTNAGQNWFALTNPTHIHLVSIYFPSSNTGYVVGARGTILKTTNAGNSWSSQTNPFPVTFFITSVHFINNLTGFAAGNGGYIIKTTNGGELWELSQSGGMGLWGITFLNVNTGLAVGGNPNNTSNIIWKTTNSGINWNVIPYTGSTALLWSARFITSSIGYIIGWEGNILKTTNGGDNWFNQASNASGILLRTCVFTNLNTGYVVGSGGVILKTTDGGGPLIDIEPVNNFIAGEFSLSQNHPNPFNPLTRIGYALKSKSNVKISVFDALGKMVEIINEGIREPGNYYVDFNGSKLSSGVYYYKLETEHFTDTKKMLLIK